MKKLLAIFVALLFLTGTSGISMAADAGTGAPKTGNHKTHEKKKTRTTKKSKTRKDKKSSTGNSK